WQQTSRFCKKFRPTCSASWKDKNSVTSGTRAYQGQRGAVMTTARKTIGRVNSRMIYTLVSLALLLVVWVVVHRYTPYLPPISEVFREITQLLSEPLESLAIIGTTLRRLVIGVAL